MPWHIDRLEFSCSFGQLKDYQIDTELLTKTLQDFRAIYNELTPEKQTRLLQLMVQEVVLVEDTLKISVFPLGDSGKPLEYLINHPEFAESDKKRATRDKFVHCLVTDNILNFKDFLGLESFLSLRKSA